MGRRKLFDWGIALLAFVLTLGVVHGGEGRDLDGVATLLAALSTLPLVLRRRDPLAVFAFTALASAGINALDYPLGPPFGPTIALFFVGLAGTEERRARLRTGAVVGTLFVLHVGAAAVAEPRLPLVELLFGTVVWTGAWLAGERTRLRRQRLVDREERAAAEERARIARDLHDSAGHAINVILVQAGAARLLRDRDPEGSRAALETIEEVARETIGEIDQLVRVLRDEPTRAPVGLAGLDGLVERHRRTGLDVEVELEGAARRLPPALDQAAFRILQEALTNAARHGSGGAHVRVSYGEDAVELDVSNPVARSDAGGDRGGLGLVGMRERAALLGGSFRAERTDGGFRVRATLPYAGAT